LIQLNTRSIYRRQGLKKSKESLASIKTRN
jgi:hypothetical protein